MENFGHLLKSGSRITLWCIVICSIGLFLYSATPGGIAGAYAREILRVAIVALAWLWGALIMFRLVIWLCLNFRRGHIPLALLAVATTAVAISVPALAQETVNSPGIGLSDLWPAPSDRAIRWMSMLFAPIMSGGQMVISPMPNTLAGMITIFNWSVFAVVTGYSLYLFSSGVLQTANDGEFLGRHWNGLWAPVRLGAVAAMLMPVFGGGFTASQVIVVRTAELGVGLGNQVWRVAAESLSSAEPIINFEVPEAYVYARQSFQAQLCAAYLNSHESEVRQRPFIAVAATAKTDTQSGDLVLSLDGQPGTSYPAGVCGSFSLPIDTASDRLNPLGPDNLEAARVMHFAQAEAATRIFNEMGAVAFEMVDARLIKLQTGAADISYGNPDLQSAAGHLTNYRIRLEQAAAQAQATLRETDLAKLRQSMLDTGWTEAGSFWMSIGRINSLTAAAANNVPAAMATPNWDAIAAKTDKRNVVELVRHADLWWAQLAPSPDRKSNRSMLIDLVDPTFRDGARNFPAFTGIIQSGQSILNAGLYLLGGAAVVDIGARVVDGVSGWFRSKTKAEDNSAANSWSNRLGGITRMAYMVAVPLIVVGFILGYAMPLLPFLYFILAAVQWFRFVVEGTLAAPLWAASHLRMDGHEFVPQSAKMGYALLLNLLLRPALLLFGLMLSFTIFEIFAGFMSERFTGVIANLNGSDTSWSNIGYAIIYVSLLLLVAVKSMNLITELPDLVLRWLGAGASDDRSSFGMAVAGAAAGAGMTMLAMGNRAGGTAVDVAKKIISPQRTGKAGPVGGGGSA
jgi:hypothetical protein